MGEAEIYLHVIFFLKLSVLKEQDVVIEGDGLHFWIAVLHAPERPVNRPYGYGQYLLKKVFAHLPVPEAEYHTRTASARYDEISLHVPQPPSFGDFSGSFRDHTLTFNPFPHRSMSAFLFEYSTPMPLNSSAVHACDIPAYGRGGDIGKLFLDTFQAFCNLFGRLIIHEVRFYESAQIRVRGDFLADLAAVAHPDVAEVLCVFGLVSAVRPFLPQFVPDSALWTMEGCGNGGQIMVFVEEYFNLSPVCGREACPLYSFFMGSFYSFAFKFQR